MSTVSMDDNQQMASLDDKSVSDVNLEMVNSDGKSVEDNLPVVSLDGIAADSNLEMGTPEGNATVVMPGGSYVLSDPTLSRKKKLQYQQAFSNKWLRDSDLKDWIKPDPGNCYAAICLVCCCRLTRIGKANLMQHKSTRKHVKKLTNAVKKSMPAEDSQAKQLKLLIERAHEAASSAYCPYTRNKTGAAVLTGEGIIYTGSSVENAIHGLSVCAERVAIMNAVCNGRKNFKALAVTSSQAISFKYPCGSCLQVLSEFEKDCDVISIKPDMSSEKKHLLDLLPYSYCAADLLVSNGGDTSEF